MKKHVRNILFTMLFLFVLSSQTMYGQKLKYGAVAGIDLANWGINGFDDYNNSIFKGPLISFNINGYMGYRWSERWGNSIEPGYIRKGQNRGPKIALHYFQLPVLTELYFGNRFFFSIGPELSYLLVAKTNQEGLNNVTEVFDNRFELSGVVGANYSINKDFDIGLKFNHGITSFSKAIIGNENGELDGEASIYNRYIQYFVRFKI